MVVTVHLTPDADAPDRLVPATGEAADLADLFTPEIGEKRGLAFVPATFHTLHRREENVEAITALVADLDHLDPAHCAEVLGRVAALPWRVLAYETFSDTPTSRCYRLVWPLAAPWPVRRWKADRSAALRALGLAEESDPACSDPAHLYFLPRHPAGQTRQVEWGGGDRWLDLADLLGAAPAETPAAPAVAAPHLSEISAEVPLPEAVARVRARLQRVAEGQREAAPFVGALLEGRELAPHGQRHRAWLRATGVLATVIVGEGLVEIAEEILHEIGEASRAAEIAAAPDAPHDWAPLEGMLHTAITRADRAAQDQASALRLLEALVGRAATSPPGEEAVAEQIEGLMAQLSDPQRDRIRRVLDDPHDVARWPREISEGEIPCYLYALHAAGWRLLAGESGAQAVRFDAASKHTRLIARTVTALAEWIPTTARVGSKILSVVKLWAREPSTPRYDHVCVTAGEAPVRHLNLWQGLAITPRDGDAAPMRDLVRALTGGEESTYLWRWIAWCVQHPTDRAEVVVVLRGPEGTGKSTLARALVQIFGAHGIQLSRASDLVGRFNATLLGNAFVIGDETCQLSRGELDVLKSLVTEPTYTIERKGVNATHVRNALSIMLLTNHEHVLPIEGEGRRFVIYDVAPWHSDRTPEDRAYWDGLHQWLDDGGVEEFLGALLREPLGTWHPRDRPVTQGLVEERARSLSGPRAWLHSVLIDGQWPGGALAAAVTDRPATTADLLRHSREWCLAQRDAPPTACGLGRLLARIGARRVLVGKDRRSAWEIDDWPDARRRFADLVGASPEALGFEDAHGP